MRRSAWLSIWPPPRRPLTKRSYVPLVLFVILLPLGCWLLEALDLAVFTRIWPFALLALAPWFWRMHVGGYSGLTPGRAGMALWSRFLLLALFIAVLAEPRVVRKDEHLSVIYAIDHSASIVRAASDEALSYVMKTVAEKPEADEAGLLFFGANAAVELPPGRSLPYEGDVVISVQIDRGGTDIAKALSLASAMLPPENQARVVLISDGVTTGGALSGVLDDLAARKIPVDVVPVDYRFENEVWIERLDLPRFVKLGQPFEASAVLSSLQAGDGVLVLEQNGEEIARQQVTFHAGKNRFAVQVDLKRPGYYEYTARIELPDGKDSWANNNEAMSFLYLKGKGSVLLVTDGGGAAEDWQSIARALGQGNREVERIDAFDLPRSSMALLPYDCIALVNVARDNFDDPQLQAVHDAVYRQGSGLIMVGGENSFGPGGYQNSAIEKALPVDMDISKRKILPKGALAIVLHTCEFPDGNTWGKRITKEAIKVLSAQDEVGVLVYDYQSGADWLFELAAAENYQAMVKQINNAQIGDMPDFATTMELGFQGLKASDASAKHMIIISDGDPSPPSPTLLAKYVAEKIRVSTVGIMPHGPNCLGMVAKATGGRFYQPKDPRQLPRIFIKEAKTLRRSAIQNKTFVPIVETPSPILRGISATPPLHGLVWTTPKTRAVTILDGPEKDDPDPVLATWRYGIGAAAAFTSDLSPRWGKDWVSWDQYAAFVQQMFTEISRAEQTNNLQVRSFAAGGRGHVVVENFAPDDVLQGVAVQVDGPGSSPRKMILKQVAPNRYEGEFPLDGKGRYQVSAAGVGGSEQKSRAFGGFVVSYSDEFLRFRSDPVTLDRIAKRTGGRTLTGRETSEDIYNQEREPRLSSRSIIDLLLLLLACLIPIDVALRRVQLDWQTVKAWIGLGHSERTETLGSLLAMKERLQQNAETREERPVPQVVSSKPKSGEATTPASASVETTPKPKSPDSPKTPPSGTTTSRLLEAKRRAQKKKP